MNISPNDHTPGEPIAAAGADPAMEDILASIRRILDEGDTEAAQAAAADDDFLLLDAAMMVAEPETAAPEIAAPDMSHISIPEPLVAPETSRIASQSMGALVRALGERNVAVSRGSGPTLEDMVREELRPMLKGWLDAYLPEIVERQVRAEIERLGK